VVRGVLGASVDRICYFFVKTYLIHGLLYRTAFII